MDRLADWAMNGVDPMAAPPWVLRIELLRDGRCHFHFAFDDEGQVLAALARVADLTLDALDDVESGGLGRATGMNPN
jgi:hypothetical protein